MAFDFAATQQRAVEAITRPTVDPTEERHGAYPRGAGTPAPFFHDEMAGLTLGRPAHIRDYQGDAAAFPFRTQRPEELASYPATQSPVPEFPRPVFTSEAEQKWLQDRDAAQRAAEAQAARAAPTRDFSQPPPSFESKLGFRSPAPFEPMPEPVREFGHQDGVSKDFFWGGTGRFVSENGTSNSQKYYSLARPLGGQLKSHYSTSVTPHGYRYDHYTNLH